MRACHNPHPANRADDGDALQAAFPSPRKQLDVLLYCRGELLAYLRDLLAATPAQLGDAR